MKKIFLTTLFLLTVTTSAFAAAPTTERFYAFSNRDKEAIEEINYYLSLGSTVKLLQSTQRGYDGTFTTIVIQIPTDVLTTKPFVKK